MRKLIYSICLICLLSAGCGSVNKPATAGAPDDWQSFVPAEYRTQFESVLALAGDNKDTLISALKAVPPEQRPGAAFLISVMTYPDIAAITKDILLEHIAYAYKARAQYPWMRHMPEDIFLHYVLPYRCAEEPISAYRKYFYEQLDPIVGQCADMADVVQQVNLWLGELKPDGSKRVRFKQNEARDQGPLATLKAGYGRCEEMMIVYMSAARSVGIPCRSAYTPFWAVCDNNHAWVEVWVDGQWKPIGGCEPGSPWFANPAKRAAAVYSAKMGPPAKSEILHRTTGSVSMINSTPNYSKTCAVNITVTADNKPVSDVTVAFSVFNFGSFRPIATKVTNQDGKAAASPALMRGKAEFIVGIGEYFLSAGNSAGRAWQVVRTTPDKTLDIVLKLEPNAAPDGYVFMRYPTAEEARLSFTSSNMAPAMVLPLIPTRPPPPETYFFEEFSPAEHPDVMALLDGYPENDALVQKLKLAGGNWPEIAGAIKECKPELRSDLFWLIRQLAHLEAVEVTKEFLLDNVSIAAQARQRADWEVPDDIYRPYVLSPLFQHLHIRQWRKELYEFSKIFSYASTEPPPRDFLPRAVNEWVQNNIKLRTDLAGRFSYTPSPLDTLRSKLGDPYGVAVFTAALLRTLGVPARIKSAVGGSASGRNDWVEFYDGAKWLPLYPHDLNNFANIRRDAKTASEYDVKPAGLKMNLFLKDGAADTNPWEKMAISRFQNGCWAYMDWDQLRRSGKWVGIPPGQYLVTAGARNSNGDAMVYCKQLDFKSGEGVVMDIPLDIPLDKLLEADRVVRKLAKVPMFQLPDLEGKIYNLTETLKTNTNPFIITFFSLDNEPSIRMLPLIDQLKDKADKAGVRILAVYIDPEGKGKFIKDGRLKSLRIPVLLDSDQKIVKQFIPDFDENKSKCLPSTLLISANVACTANSLSVTDHVIARIVIWDEGYNMAIGSFIESELDLMLDATKNTLSIEPKITYQAFDIGPDYAGDAERYYKAGEYGKSLELYIKALEFNPDDAGLWYNIACDCALLGKVDDGINALKKALGYGYSELYWMDNDPDLAKLREDPRYKELRK
ncbi:MAG: transglutaminase domain-containing protein [Planctomycetota bacterium]